MDYTKPKYKNVTISGLPGAGSSTLGCKLASEIKWKYFCGGDFMRSYALEKGLIDNSKKTHHDATVYDDDFDRQVDYQARRWLLENENQVLESWLSGFMAQQVPGTLKVLVYCSDDAVRIDRIVNRDNISVDEAKKHIFEREHENLMKWIRMYSNEWQQWVVKTGTLPANNPIYFWDPKIYDLAIDTYKLSKEETLKAVIKTLF